MVAQAGEKRGGMGWLGGKRRNGKGEILVFRGTHIQAMSRSPGFTSKGLVDPPSAPQLLFFLNRKLRGSLYPSPFWLVLGMH